MSFTRFGALAIAIFTLLTAGCAKKNITTDQFEPHESTFFPGPSDEGTSDVLEVFPDLRP